MRALVIGVVAVTVGIGALLHSTTVAAVQVQWSGNGHYYEAIAVPGGVNPDGTYWGGISWVAARDAAIARGGHLATINSAEESAFVYSLVTPDMWVVEKATGAGIGPWLGLYQPAGSSEPGGNWQWVTGEPLTYTNWGNCLDNGYLGPLSPGEDRSEEALHLYSYSTTWNDYPDWAPTLGYVVESVPEPSTIVIWGTGAFGLLAYAWRRRKQSA